MKCKIAEKKKLANDIFDITVFCPETAEDVKPGQFVHILCGNEVYLRRPISICEVAEGKSLRFIFQVKGEGTKALSSKKVGDEVDFLGPLGNGFDIEDADEDVIVIGGGIGIFPLLELTKRIGKRASVMLGFRSAENIILEDEFSKYTDKLFVATEDGSLGYKGFVTELLENALKSNKVDKIYTCGPMPMMKAVSDVAKEYGIPAYASLEERMGCGIGACVGCTATVNGEKKRVCKDGPVFNAWEVEWDG